MFVFRKSVILVLFLLSACGFKSVYDLKAQSNNSDILYSLEVEVEKGRLKNRVYEKELKDLINKEVIINRNEVQDFDYLLVVSLNKIKRSSARRSSGSVGRYDAVIILNYKIIDNKDKEEIDFGKIEVIDGFEVSDSRFTTYTIEESLSRDVLYDAVIELRSRIINSK